MIQQNEKTGKNAQSLQAAKDVLFGTTGIAILSTAAVGVAGFLIWKNREQIKTFVSKYVDLPEFLEGGSDESLNHSKSGNLSKPTYSSSSSTAHRM